MEENPYQAPEGELEPSQLLPEQGKWSADSLDFKTLLTLACVLAFALLGLGICIGLQEHMTP